MEKEMTRLRQENEILKKAMAMLNPFINSELEIALNEFFRDNIMTEQVLQTTDIRKVRLIVYVSPKRLQFVFADEDEERTTREQKQSFLVPTYWG